MDNNKTTNYYDRAHLIGRIGSLLAVFFMVGIPAFIAIYYNIWPGFGGIIKGALPLLAIYVPIAAAEVVSYMPTLGTSSYVTFITGNVLNLKLPCSINAVQLTKTTPGTEEADAVSAVAVASSSILTMIIIALGVVLLTPLQPYLQNETVVLATKYMLPALFGGMFVPMLLNQKAGDYQVKNRNLILVIPMIVIVLVHFFVTPIVGKEGYTIILTIIALQVISKIFYDKGIIEMIKIEKPKE